MARPHMLWQAAAVSVLIHVLAIWSVGRLPATGSIAGLNPMLPLEITLIQPRLPSGRREPAVVESIPRGVANLAKPGKTLRQEAVVLPVPSERVPEAETPAGASPLRPSTDSMIDAAKRDIAKIDRQLRQAFPSRQLMPMQSTASPLEKGIAAAGLPRSMTMQDIVLPDGSRITKVVMPGTTYCVLGRKAGAGITENELAALTTTTCPN